MRDLTASEIDQRFREYRGPIPGDALVNSILDGILELQKNNMNKYFKFRDDAVRYVNAHVKRSALDYALTITIEPVKSGGYSVSIATDTSSVATRTQNSSNGLDVT